MQSEGRDALNEKGQSTIKSTAFLGVDALCFTIESIFQHVPAQKWDVRRTQQQHSKVEGHGNDDPSVTIPEEVLCVCRVLQRVLDHQPQTDPVLLAKFAQIIPAFAGLFKARLDFAPPLAAQVSAAFNECVKRLLNCSAMTSDGVEKEGGFVVAQSLHSDVLFARRKAGSSLVALSKTVAPRMMGNPNPNPNPSPNANPNPSPNVNPNPNPSPNPKPSPNPNPNLSPNPNPRYLAPAEYMRDRAGTERRSDANRMAAVQRNVCHTQVFFLYF